MDRITKKIENISQYGIKFGLENIKKIMNEFDNPQNNYKTIHIAGTNGKGSTATYIEKGLIEKGYKVGKYTSPHLVFLNERITINGNNISDKDLYIYLDKIRKCMKKININLTFFEIVTAIMFLYFKDENIDWGIIETGMGGRLDSTNIILSEVSIITNISMDHSNFLGDTIEEIAEEKAGIIKKDIPLIINENNERISKIYSNKTDNIINISQEKFSVELDKKRLSTNIIHNNKEYKLPLFGKHQAYNFLMALKVLEYIRVEEKFIKNSLKDLNWEGRFEIVKKNPYTILDGAHNIQAVKMLKENVLSLSKKKENLLIISILEDKEKEDIFVYLSEISEDCVFISLDDMKRGQKAKQLSEKWGKYFNNYYCYEDIKKAYGFAESTNKNIIICGSLYLVGKFKREVQYE